MNCGKINLQVKCRRPRHQKVHRYITHKHVLLGRTTVRIQMKDCIHSDVGILYFSLQFLDAENILLGEEMTPAGN